MLCCICVHLMTFLFGRSEQKQLAEVIRAMIPKARNWKSSPFHLRVQGKSPDGNHSPPSVVSTSAVPASPDGFSEVLRSSRLRR